MSKEIVLDRLNNLKYLRPLKNANISIISKNNVYGDVVKFFAQINTEEVIQKISFKATGCSYFIAFCDYYCQLVEGKNLKKVEKITIEDLEKFVKLDKSRIHVAEIILSTMTALIKKYKKGVSKGSITPCQIEEELERIDLNSEINIAKKSKKEDVEISLTKKYAKHVDKKASRKTNAKNIEVVINSEKDIVKNKPAKQTSVKNNINSERIINIKDNKDEITQKIKKTEDTNEQSSNVRSVSSLDMLLNDMFKIRQSEIEKDQTISKVEISGITDSKSNKKSAKNIDKTTKKTKQEKSKKQQVKNDDFIIVDSEETSNTNDKKEKHVTHANKLASLSSKISKTDSGRKDEVDNEGKEKTSANLPRENKISNLSMMINNINSSNSIDTQNQGTVTITTEVKKRTSILSIRNSLSSIRAKQEVSSDDNNQDVREIVIESTENSSVNINNSDNANSDSVNEIIVPENTETKEEKKKKGLFNWFRKK